MFELVSWDIFFAHSLDLVKDCLRSSSVGFVAAVLGLSYAGNCARTAK